MYDAAGIAPPIPPDEALRIDEEYRAWKGFHNDVLNRGESLDRVIGVIGDVLNQVHKEDEEEHVTDSDIFGHFYCHLMTRAGYDIEDNTERNRLQANHTHNLLRTLKRFRDDEAHFQLPYQDRKYAQEFIDRLQFPPTEWRSLLKSGLL